MKVRVVRDENGRVVCAVPLDATGPDEVTVEPVVDGSRRAEDVDLPRIDQSRPEDLLSGFGSG